MIEHLDAPGAGVNDPAAPDAASYLGGNTGATLGEQRLLALQLAVDVWAAALTSIVPIELSVALEPLACEGESLAVLGDATTGALLADFEGAPLANTWYPVALANQFSGYDLAEETSDIEASFNAAIDTNACLGAARWYYGFDGNPPFDSPDFVATVLHELAHGLGFGPMGNLKSGQFLDNTADIFSTFIYDLDAELSWPNMNNAERAASASNVRRVVWSGPHVTAAAAAALAAGTPVLTKEPPITTLSAVLNESNLGPRLSDTPIEGALVIPSDATACRELESLAGIALIFPGNCQVTQQALTVQKAGAMAALIVSTQNTTPPGDLFTTQPEPDVTIPVLAISASDASLLAVASDSVPLILRLSLGAALTGAGPDGRLLLNATSPVAPGTTLSHWDALARRSTVKNGSSFDLLMESYSKVHGAKLDLTVALLQDLGWNSAPCTAENTSQDGSSDCAPEQAEGPDAGSSSNTTKSDAGTFGNSRPSQAAGSAKAETSSVGDTGSVGNAGSVGDAATTSTARLDPSLVKADSGTQQDKSPATSADAGYAGGDGGIGRSVDGVLNAEKGCQCAVPGGGQPTNTGALLQLGFVLLLTMKRRARHHPPED